MSLHDIDKSDLTRGNPIPNAHDTIIEGATKAHQTLSSTYKTDASVANVRMSFKHGMILWYDDHNRVISVSGFIPQLANYPVTIDAIYGYDVFTDILGITSP